MITINNAKKSNGPGEIDHLHFTCQECKKKLKVNQIVRKRIVPFRTFNLFIFYCIKCNLTYFIFKYINRKEEK